MNPQRRHLACIVIAAHAARKPAPQLTLRCTVGLGSDSHAYPDGFDPMFRLNHPFATPRQDSSKLGRSTGATTKKLEGLYNHPILYLAWHNIYAIAQDDS